MIRIPCLAFAVAAYAMIAGCAGPPDKVANRAEVKTKVGRAVERVCALPEPDRQAEIQKLKKETGFELQCAESSSAEDH